MPTARCVGVDPNRSRMDVTAVDPEGNTVVCLERKSVQPYRSQDEYLYAMKEDLAEWFNTLYSTNVTVDDFLEYLETGVVLCQHANKVNEYIIEQFENGAQPRHWNKEALELAKQVIQYKRNVKPGSFQCRDNISNYISWCRWTLGIPDTLLFESDDLVLRKNERNVVLCVLEVARRGAKFGMLAPCLVQLEQEIDAEISGEVPPERPEPQRPRRTIDMMSLDEMVREIAKECTCPDQFPIIRISDGKYKVGENSTLIFVRILRNHVMVRIGGGWDTLENYLNRHDPCRCDANKSQHQTRRFSQATPKRRSSMTSPAPQPYPDATKPRKLPPTPNSSSTDGYSPRSDSGRRTPSAVQRNLDRVRRSDDGDNFRPTSGQHGRPQSPSLSRRAISPQPSGFVKPEPIRPQPRRPASADPTAPQNLQTIRKADRSRSGASTAVASNSIQHSRPTSRNEDVGRGRSPSRDRTNTKSRHARSRSVGSEEMRRNLLKSTVGSDKSSVDVIMISRDKSGRHVINKQGQRAPSNVTVPITNGNGTGNGVGNMDRRPNSARMKISPEKLLPSKPKAIMRSQSVETKSLGEQAESVPGSCSSINSDVTSDRPNFNRQGSSPGFGSAVDLCDMPAPVGDHKLNREMEKLFEEYRRAEKGWFHYDDADEEVDMLSASASSIKSAPASSGSRATRPASAGTARRNQRTATATATSGRKTPTGPSARIRPTTPVKPAIQAGSGTPASSRTGNVGITPRRSSTPSTPVISRRSQTPNPIPTNSAPSQPARCRTPLIKARVEDVKPRTDTGLRKRPTTPQTTPAADSRSQRKPVTRSASLSRVAIRKQLCNDDQNMTLTTKRRSRSKDDILDDFNESRRSRSDTARKRDTVQSGGQSGSRDQRPAAATTPGAASADSLREPPRSLPPTPGMLSMAALPDPVTVDIPIDGTDDADRPSTRIIAKPRRDDRDGPRTRIPRPSSTRPFQSPEPGALKRFDSGVDINISPTENNSVQGDDEFCNQQHSWQAPEAVTLAGQTLGYTTVTDTSDEYY